MSDQPFRNPEELLEAYKKVGGYLREPDGSGAASDIWALLARMYRQADDSFGHLSELKDYAKTVERLNAELERVKQELAESRDEEFRLAYGVPEDEHERLMDEITRLREAMEWGEEHVACCDRCAPAPCECFRQRAYAAMRDGGEVGDEQ